MRYKVTIYRCKTITEATDRSNLFYIATTAAAGIQKDTTGRQITVTGRKGNPLAVFTY